MKIRSQLWAGLLVALLLLQLQFGILGTPDGFNADAALDERVISGQFQQEVSLQSLALYNFVHLTGGWEWLEAGDTTVARSRYNDAVIEGTFTGTWLQLYALQAGQVFELELDQAIPITVQVPSKNSYGYIKLAKDLPIGTHHFRLRLANRAGGQLLARSLRSDGYWEGANVPRRTRLLGYGSSTIDGCGITWQLSQHKGWEAINRGVGGTTVINEGQHWVARDVLPFQPDVLLINYGSNDWFANLPLNQFQTAYTNMLRQIATGAPRANFVILGIFPRQGGNEATRGRYNQAIQNAIGDAGINQRTHYTEISGYNWASDTSDGTHPNQQAVATKFLPQLLPLLSAPTT